MSISKKFYNIVFLFLAMFALVGCSLGQLPGVDNEIIYKSNAEADVAVTAENIFFNTEDLTVSNHLFFPTTTNWPERPDKIKIVWESSNPDIIANDGTVTRPVYGSGNAEVTVKVTITSEYTRLDDGSYSVGVVSTEKEWTFTVLEAGKVYTIADIKNDLTFVADETEVSFSGIVVALSKYKGANYPFVYDGTDGMYVFIDSPEVKVGDRVEVSALYDVYYNLVQVSAGSVTVVESGVELPLVEKGTISDVVAANGYMISDTVGVAAGKVHNVDAKVVVETGADGYENAYLQDPFTGERFIVHYETGIDYVPGNNGAAYLDYLKGFDGKYVNITVVNYDRKDGDERVMLTGYEIVEIAEPELSDSQKATVVINGLSVAEAAIADFELATEVEYGTIAWEVASGSGIEIVEGVAKVTRTTVAQEAVLKATVTVGEVVLTKEFTVAISGLVFEPISYEEATNIAGTDGTYTTDKYYLEGVITEVYNTQYGNMYITDGVNSFTIYGTYSADGVLRYDAMENAPKAGDRVIVYGILGSYKGAAQMKNGWIVAQEPGTELETVSNKEAIELSGTTKNEYTEGKYNIKGIVTEVANATYGNMYIQDIYGVSFYVYGVYNHDGSVRYDAMEKAPQVGDFVVLSGILGYYSDAQMKNGWLLQLNGEVYGVEQPKHEHVVCPTCGLCTAADCDGTAEEKCAGHEVSGEAVTVSVSVADYAAANGWENSKLYESMAVCQDITITVSGTPVGSWGANSGKYYTSGNAWRIYQNENPAITFTAAAGCQIVSVKISYTVDKTGILTLNGANVETDKVVDVNASTITFSVGNTGTATNGQVRITAVEVVYVGGSSEPIVPEHKHTECPTCGLCTAASCPGTDAEKCQGHVVESKVITIAEAIEIASKQAHNTYTTEKYIITGTVDDLYNTVYGNMHLLDGKGGDITIYGLYIEGSKYGDYSGTKPVVGDVITVEGVLGTYNGKPQMKNADFVAFAGETPEPPVHEHVFVEGKCECGEEDPNYVAPHEHVACDKCGLCTAEDCTGTDAEKCAGHEVAGEAVTVSVSVADYATANGWTDGKLQASLVIDSNVKINVSGTAVGSYGQNTGKFYVSDNTWRIYQNENPSITFVVAEGCKIVSVKITYSVSKTGVLTLNGSNVASKTVVDVNASTITFGVGNTGTATNGQVRITAVEVVYAAETPEPPVHEHVFVEGKCECGEEDPNYVAPHEHVACEKCGLCTAEDCTGTDAEKCAGHEHTHELELKGDHTSAEGHWYECACGYKSEYMQHVDENLDITCDYEGCTKRIIPAVESKISLFTARHMIIVSLSGNYYMEGVITEITDAKNGVFVIADEAGDTIIVNMPKNAAGQSYSAWTDLKVVVGDTIQLYGKPTRNTSSQQAEVKNALLTVLKHEHAFGEATCLEPATCGCLETTGEPLGHLDEDANCFCDRCEWDLRTAFETIVTRHDDIKGTENEDTTNGTLLFVGKEFNVQVAKGTGSILAGTNHFRVKQNNILTISSTNGRKIVSVILTATTSSYVDELEAFLTSTGCEYVVNELSATITVDSLEELVLTNTSAKTARIASVKVVYGVDYTPEQTPEEPQEIEVTLYYKNADKWAAVSTWIWNDYENFTGGIWPGAEMTLVEGTTDWYSYTFKVLSTEGIKVIFNDNGKGSQSKDLSYTGLNYWYGGNAYATKEEAEAAYAADQTIAWSNWYLRGGMNSWGTADRLQMDAEGNSWIVVDLAKNVEFKVATSDWSKEFNFNSVTDKVNFVSAGGNIKVVTAGTYKIVVTAAGKLEITPVVE